MTISESLLPEFDQETATTRKILERIPEDKLDWKPHEKSTTLGALATHLANLLTWTVTSIEHDEFDMAPPGGEPPRVEPVTSAEHALQVFDANRQAARAAIAGAGDERLLGTWTLKRGGNAMFSMPRVGVVRSFVMNHMIHHRAQLGVYLRLNDVPVPSTYGPSADESGM